MEFQYDNRPFPQLLRELKKKNAANPLYRAHLNLPHKNLNNKNLTSLSKVWEEAIANDPMIFFSAVIDTKKHANHPNLSLLCGDEILENRTVMAKAFYGMVRKPPPRDPKSPTPKTRNIMVPALADLQISQNYLAVTSKPLPVKIVNFDKHLLKSFKKRKPDYRSELKYNEPFFLIDMAYALLLLEAIKRTKYKNLESCPIVLPFQEGLFLGNAVKTNPDAFNHFLYMFRVRTVKGYSKFGHKGGHIAQRRNAPKFTDKNFEPFKPLTRSLELNTYVGNSPDGKYKLFPEQKELVGQLLSLVFFERTPPIPLMLASYGLGYNTPHFHSKQEKEEVNDFISDLARIIEGPEWSAYIEFFLNESNYRPGSNNRPEP